MPQLHAGDARAAAMEIINLVKHRQDWSIYWNYERFRIVNLRNWAKLDNLGILKQLYYLIYQCLERLKLLELSNNQGLQKFTILEFRPFLHIENIIISRFITLIHNQKVIHKQPNRLFLHIENVEYFSSNKSITKYGR